MLPSGAQVARRKPTEGAQFAVLPPATQSVGALTRKKTVMTVSSAIGERLYSQVG
jgi:hypothetical protein